MFEQVQKLLAAQLEMDPGDISPESDIKFDLGADSLDILALLTRIEKRYGLVIPDEALARFRTVSDIVSYLEQRQI